ARENLYDFLQRDILFQDEKECFYIYRQKMGDYVQHGIVACVSVDDYESGLIKKHELTRKDKELDRTRHISSVNAQTGPVFLTYKASQIIDMTVKDTIMGNPEYDFTADDGIVHTVWVVDNDKQIERIKEGFGKLDSLYIADGHHRAASAVAVARMRRENNTEHNGREEYNRIMVFVCPHNQLNVTDYNRVVKDLGGLDEGQFISRLQENFILSDDHKERSPRRQGEFGMYMDGVWRRLQAVEDDTNRDDSVARLDVSILQDRLLKPLLGIGDPRTDNRITFVGGVRGMDELERIVDSGEYKVAFSLYPTSMDQLMEIADMGKIMPPKSTWFEPKPRSGIFAHLLD
ncbi:MAG: DUF1015 family protein, partial [Thermodesulfobacteriota bacterium]|nr:DUF1015 family protein [Thermodesulfobacteriota bacterium]